MKLRDVVTVQMEDLRDVARMSDMSEHALNTLGRIDLEKLAIDILVDTVDFRFYDDETGDEVVCQDYPVTYIWRALHDDEGQMGVDIRGRSCTLVVEEDSLDEPTEGDITFAYRHYYGF